MRWPGHQGCVHRPPPWGLRKKQVNLTSNSDVVLGKLLMVEVNETLYSAHIVYSLSNLFTVGSGLNPSIQKASNYRNNTVLYE